MNIYMITRKHACDEYDIFDGAVVYAKDAQEARNMHPRDGKPINWPKRSTMSRDTWERDPKNVVAKLVGTAPNRKRPGVIMSDFSPG